MLFLDGVSVEDRGRLRLRRMKAPVRAELEALAQSLSERIGRRRERRGLLAWDAENGYLGLEPEGEDALANGRFGEAGMVGRCCPFALAAPSRGSPGNLSGALTPVCRHRASAGVPGLASATRTPARGRSGRFRLRRRPGTPQPHRRTRHPDHRQQEQPPEERLLVGDGGPGHYLAPDTALPFWRATSARRGGCKALLQALLKRRVEPLRQVSTDLVWRHLRDVLGKLCLDQGGDRVGQLLAPEAEESRRSHQHKSPVFVAGAPSLDTCRHLLGEAHGFLSLGAEFLLLRVAPIPEAVEGSARQIGRQFPFWQSASRDAPASQSPAADPSPHRRQKSARGYSPPPPPTPRP